MCSRFVYPFSVKRASVSPLGAVLVALVSTTGCLAPKTVRPLGSAIAIKGQQVSSAALDAYSELAKQPAVDRSQSVGLHRPKPARLQQNFIKVATSPNPASINLSTTNANMALQLAPRVAAYRVLLNTYATYQTLTDSNFGNQIGSASSSLLASFNALKSIPDVPSSISGVISGLAAEITEAQQLRCQASDDS
jgi:hypothetical protein